MLPSSIILKCEQVTPKDARDKGRREEDDSEHRDGHHSGTVLTCFVGDDGAFQGNRLTLSGDVYVDLAVAIG